MRNVERQTQTPEEYLPKQPRRGVKETVEQGREIYKREIRERVEPKHVGRYIAIDVESGCWALGDSIEEARDRLESVRPEAVDVLLEKIGYNATGSIGGGAPRRTSWSKE